jgi:hypothetical protein
MNVKSKILIMGASSPFSHMSTKLTLPSRRHLDHARDHLQGFLRGLQPVFRRGGQLGAVRTSPASRASAPQRCLDRPRRRSHGFVVVPVVTGSRSCLLHPLDMAMMACFVSQERTPEHLKQLLLQADLEVRTKRTR